MTSNVGLSEPESSDVDLYPLEIKSTDSYNHEKQQLNQKPTSTEFRVAIEERGVRGKRRMSRVDMYHRPVRRCLTRSVETLDDQQQQPHASDHFFTDETTAPRNENEPNEQTLQLNFRKEDDERGKNISSLIQRKKWKEADEELTKIFNMLHVEHEKHGILTPTTIQSILSQLTREVLQQVSLPPFDRDCDKMRVKKDEIGSEILKSFYDCALEVYESKPDGNCLFNSLSISLFGHDSYTQHIRFIILKFYVENYDHIKSMKDNDFFWTEGIDTSLSNCARLGCLGDVAAIYCASRALSVTIRLIYPPINGFLDDWFLRVPKYFEPVAQSKAEVFIMFTSSTSIHVGFFQPDHFLPVFRNFVDASRRAVNLTALEGNFSDFVSNQAPSDSITVTNGNALPDDETEHDQIVANQLVAIENDGAKNLVESCLTTGVSPYQPISDVKERLRHILNFPHIYKFIPECSKSDCQFIVRYSAGNKKFDDRCGPWIRVDRRTNKFFDKSNYEEVLPLFGKNTEYVYKTKRKELTGEIPVEENVVLFYETNYIHKDNPDYTRKIYVVHNLCFFQYVGSIDNSLNYTVNYTPIDEEVIVIKYVLAFEPKSPTIPLGFKDDCQFVVIDGNTKRTFCDKVGPWIRTSKTCVRYFDPDDDYRMIKKKNHVHHDNVIKLHSSKFHHKNSSSYHRNIYVVNEFVFFQYYGSPPIEIRTNYKKSLVAKPAWSNSERSNRKEGLMRLSVPQVALVLLTDENKDIDLNDMNSFGIYYSPGPKLTQCAWKHETGHRCSVKLTEKNGNKQCMSTKAKGADVLKISHNIYYCQCNDQIQRQTFVLEGKVLVKFFGVSPEQCVCDPERSYENLKAIVRKNMKVPTAKLYLANKDIFRNEIQIFNIKAKIHAELYKKTKIEMNIIIHMIMLFFEFRS